jgi:hypothetical protein
MSSLEKQGSMIMDFESVNTASRVAPYKSKLCRLYSCVKLSDHVTGTWGSLIAYPTPGVPVAVEFRV